MQTERCREGPAVISSNTPGQPVGLSIVQIRNVNDRIVDQTTPHSPRCIRFTLHLFEPQGWFRGWIRRTEIGDHVNETRMMDSEQYTHVFILDESIHITIHLHHNTAVVKHSESVHN